jgi:sRNA-binding protein
VAAAFNGELECVQALLESGADINHATTNLNTPLMKAAVYGHTACVRFLLGSGADVNKVNNKGMTAKMLAEEAMAEHEKRKGEISTAELGKQQQEPGQDAERAKAAADVSIQDKRNKATKGRLTKLIADYKKVIKDLGRTADEIKGEYADLFEDSSVMS